MQADPGECSILILPGLSAAFDTVDPRILIERLRQWVGTSGSALDWISYLSDRTFSVTADNYASSTESLLCRVPLGLRATLKVSPTDADNIQLYISFRPHIRYFEDWMSDNCLQLHTDRTEVLVSAPAGVVPNLMESLVSLPSSVKPTLYNPAVSMGCESWPTCKLFCSCFCQLTNIIKLRSIVLTAQLVTVTHHNAAWDRLMWVHQMVPCCTNP